MKQKNKNMFIVLSVLLLLTGAMLMDPYASIICFALAGIFSLAAVFTITSWARYIALGLLLIIVLLAITEFPQARDHYKAYRHKSLSGNEK